MVPLANGAMQVLTKKEYPNQLREIPDPPKRMYLIGNLPENHKYLAVVGSRRHSEYGKATCRHLIEGLAGFPISIVSGLAIGIDSIAHKEALRAGLHTLACPGSGLDEKVLYPRTNIGLAREIVSSGGALISEFEPETRARPDTFPKRNRIMAGLAQAVLIIEATEKSGTLITARLAAEYNRDLLVVPGSIFSPNSAGIHQFLKLGAAPVTESRDILEILGINSNKKENEELSKNEQLIMNILIEGPVERSELIEQSGLKKGEANVLLATMELKNLIEEFLGKIVVKK